jgi:hypothetical protein
LVLISERNKFSIQDWLFARVNQPGTGGSLKSAAKVKKNPVTREKAMRENTYFNKYLNGFIDL